jgi:hypothetical protein
MGEELIEELLKRKASILQFEKCNWFPISCIY